MRSIPYAFVFIIFQLSVVFTKAQNITDLETFEKSMKPGTVLTYDLTKGEVKYQLIATLKKLGDEISFDWKQTEPEKREGSVLMNTAAVSKAEALVHAFPGGESKLEKESSVFISRKIFNDISASAQASLKLNGATDTITVLSNTISEFNFNLNGNLVAVPGWELQGGSDIKYTLDVLESVKFPLIVHIDFGWTMQLSEIKSP